MQNNAVRFSTTGVILVVFFLGLLNFEIRNAEDVVASTLTWSVIHRIVSIFSVSLFLILRAPLLVSKILSNRILLIFFCYLIYRAMTTVWSVSPIWTAYRVFEYGVVFCLFVFLVCRGEARGDPEYLVKAVVKYNIFLVVTLLIGVVVFPDAVSRGGVLPRIHGIFPILSPTSIAQISSLILLVVLAGFLDRRKILKYSLFGICLALFVSAQNRTGLVVISIYLMILSISASRSLLGLIFAILFGASALALVLFNGDVVMSYVLRGQDMATLSSLSSRTVMWESTLQNFYEGSLRGKIFGLGSFAGVRFLVAGNNFYETNESSSLFSTDNLWLEILIHEGLIGVLFVVVISFYITKYIFCMDRGKRKLVSVCLWSGLLLSSFTVGNMLLHTNLLFFCVLMVSAMSYEQSRRARLTTRSYLQMSTPRIL